MARPQLILTEECDISVDEITGAVTFSIDNVTKGTLDASLIDIRVGTPTEVEWLAAGQAQPPMQGWAEVADGLIWIWRKVFKR